MVSSSIPWELTGALDSLAAAVRAVAEPLAQQALASTTLGRERAILRLLGVTGIDREGRPLAAEVVDRYVSGRRERLATGVALPFAVALLEYDSTPQALALDVASGAVDLALEAELLGDAGRRAAASDHLARLIAAAVARIDANRIARRELRDVLGDRPVPWIGTTLQQPVADAAQGEVAGLVHAGIDVVRVEVPAGRELATRLVEIGREIDWRPRTGGADAEPAPAGSQRGLGRLRDLLDRAAAERGAYVRLSIVPTALATPEGAVVAALERADLLDLDPMAEIVTTGVDPARAIADFAFAVRVARRAGAAVHLGAGPLVVAPDLDAGVNSDPATRSGRALALQLVAADVARRMGLSAELLIPGAIPAWTAGEPQAAAVAIAEVTLRRALLPGMGLAFVEPAGDEPSPWPVVASAVQPGTGVALVLRQVPAGPTGAGEIVVRARAAGSVARELDAALGERELGGTALGHARASLEVARSLLESLARDGWLAVTGATPDGGWGRLGGESVAPAEPDHDAVERALA